MARKFEFRSGRLPNCSLRECTYVNAGDIYGKTAALPAETLAGEQPGGTTDWGINKN